MREYNARLGRIVVGLPEAAVKSILGEPTAVASRDKKATPSDLFRAMGSMFRFPDDESDAVWAYVDPNRPRVRHYIGFKRQKVCATWKETLTQERLEELQRSGGS